MRIKRQPMQGAVLCLAFMLVTVLFSGCSGSNGDSPAGESASPPESSESAGASGNETPEQDLSPIEFTINTSDDKLKWDTPINKIITEKTGVTLKYDLTVGDQFQRWDLWLASNDYPDIVVLDPKYTLKYKEAGAIIPLNDLIDKYGPNIKEKFGEHLDLLKDENGEIYSLYSVIKAKEASPDLQGNFIIQYDVLKDAGYPEIKTLQQLHDIVKTYKEKYPQIDGKETIGFGAYMAGWTMKHAFNNPVIFGNGWADHGNYQISEAGEVTYNPISEETRIYYRYLNQMYNEGLFDKEAFSMDEKAFQAKVAQGRVLAAYAPGWLVSDAEKSLRAAGMPERAYAHLPIYFNDGIVDRSNATTPTSAGNYQWAISKKAKNPERIIQFIDYLFSDEAQVLTHWGIEGEDYTVVDGKRVISPDLVTKRQTDQMIDYDRGFMSVGTGSTFWFGIGNGAKLADGDYATPVTKDVVSQGYDGMTKEVLAKYGKQVWADFLAPVEYTPGFLWQLTPPEETKVEEQKIDDLWRKNIPKIIMAKDEKAFEEAWSAMKADIEKAGVDKVNAAYTKLWQDFIASNK